MSGGFPPPDIFRFCPPIVSQSDEMGGNGIVWGFVAKGNADKLGMNCNGKY